MTVCKIGQEAYAQLRNAAKTSVNSVLSTFNAINYDWMDDEETEDIVSDAVAKALRTFEEEGGCSFRGWVKRLAYQITIDRLNAHRETVGITYETEDGDEVEISELGVATTPEDVVIGWECEEALDDCISSRSELDAHIYKLHFLGYPPREIASQLGVTSNFVSVRLDRIKKAVTKYVAA